MTDILLTADPGFVFFSCGVGLVFIIAIIGIFSDWLKDRRK